MNHLHYGDNLPAPREHIATGSVDLVHLDPPFNSNASHNAPFRSPTGDRSAAQIEAFDDTWQGTDAAEAADPFEGCSTLAGRREKRHIERRPVSRAENAVS